MRYSLERHACTHEKAPEVQPSQPPSRLSQGVTDPDLRSLTVRGYKSSITTRP